MNQNEQRKEEEPKSSVKKLYSMSETCERTGIPYETLKFWCNKGLVPNVRRSESNYRLFDENNIGWIESLKCLKRCGMSMEEMLRYKDLCLAGKSSIPERRKILGEKLKILEAEKEKIQASIDYISWKNNFYNDVESGKTTYKSYLLPEYEEE